MGIENPNEWTAKINGLKKYTTNILALEEVKKILASTMRRICRVGREDPRRVFHSLKVGFSLTLVTLLYLMEPLFEGIGQNAVWAVMTVVVVLEFTAGATLCKGLNRGLGTFLAGSLAFLIEYIAQETGRVYRAIFIGTAVFVIGAAATYMRFFPCIKKNYEYGVVIFLLTFNLITVSSYRVHNVLKIAHERFYTIAIGCGICLLMSLFIFPNWSGQDLHNSTVSKLQGLANSIEVARRQIDEKQQSPLLRSDQYVTFRPLCACVDEYFRNETVDEDKEKILEDPIYKGYKAVLDSKSIDETLALHASWEPPHSIHCYRLPWQQYVKLGDVLRHFGYTVVALHGCIQTQIQTPRSVRALFKDPCIQVAAEVTKALLELAESIKNHRQCSPEIISDHLHQALQDLDTALKSQPRLFLGSKATDAKTNMYALAAATATEKSSQGYGALLSSVKTDTSALLKWKSQRVREQGKEAEKKMLRPTLSKISVMSLEFSEALPFAAFASLLVEAVARLDLVIEEVEELGRVANFREYNSSNDQVVVICQKPGMGNSAPSKNNLPSHGSE